MIEEVYEDLLKKFISYSKEFFGNELTGIYLHGSAIMGCFNPEKSDLDLLVIVREEISNEAKRKFMDMVMELNKQAPAKGLELSVVKEEVCNPFVYPTPFELHFSNAHLDWYQSNPQDYMEKMTGTDKDLAAHLPLPITGEWCYTEKKFPKFLHRYQGKRIWTVSGVILRMQGKIL